MTKLRLMSSLLPSRLRLQKVAALRSAVVGSTACASPALCSQACRCFAQVHDLDSLNRDVYFTSTSPRLTGGGDHRPPDERTLQLGKTVRELHTRLPTLLQSPLPSEILSPQISLHLFPSTHPHLPTVSGRIAYVAALWTAPVAWGRVPLVGNVKLTILSERMVRNGVDRVEGGGGEKLVVKWKTCGKTKFRDGSGGVYRGVGIGAKDPVERIKTFISGLSSGSTAEDNNKDEEFCGIFIFEFDDKGRIAKHVIEHTEQGGRWDDLTRVVSVTDWLLGSLNGKRRAEQGMPELALCEERPEGRALRLMDRTRRLV
ncbi:hypothetical protein LTR95_008565 [Oleoguttula sp. CCFEE 5521]